MSKNPLLEPWQKSLIEASECKLKCKSLKTDTRSKLKQERDEYERALKRIAACTKDEYPSNIAQQALSKGKDNE